MLHINQALSGEIDALAQMLVRQRFGCRASMTLESDANGADGLFYTKHFIVHGARPDDVIALNQALMFEMVSLCGTYAEEEVFDILVYFSAALAQHSGMQVA